MLVLVVDDERSLCQLVADTIEEHCEVLMAYNGKQALNLLNKHSPDLIITDIMMPGMSGIELLQAIKAEVERAKDDVPIILMSAVPPPRLETLKADAFIAKPFDIDEVEQTVLKLLKKQPRRKQRAHKILSPFEDEAEQFAIEDISA